MIGISSPATVFSSSTSTAPLTASSDQRRTPKGRQTACTTHPAAWRRSISTSCNEPTTRTDKGHVQHVTASAHCKTLAQQTAACSLQSGFTDLHRLLHLQCRADPASERTQTSPTRRLSGCCCERHCCQGYQLLPPAAVAKLGRASHRPPCARALRPGPRRLTSNMPKAGWKGSPTHTSSPLEPTRQHQGRCTTPFHCGSTRPTTWPKQHSSCRTVIARQVPCSP